jgi:hypothetical protein
VRVQSGHSERLGPLAPSGEPARLIEYGPCARIIRTVALEDRQRGLRAGHGIARNLAHLSHAELHHQTLVTHEFILARDYRALQSPVEYAAEVVLIRLSMS